MKKNVNKKGFTLVELLAVIVVLAIVMGIAAVAITSVLDTTRKNAFVASAEQYIHGAKQLIQADTVSFMLDPTATGGTYLDSTVCITNSTGVKIKLSDIKTENGTMKSPYGGDFKSRVSDSSNPNGSYVLVIPKSAACDEFEYYIRLTDGTNCVDNTGSEHPTLKGSLVGTNSCSIS